ATHYFAVAARLALGRDVGGALARLDTLLARPSGDVFWMYQAVLVRYAGADRLPDAYRRRLRDLWRTYTPYRGDTENHWLMYYAALYLASQLHPDDPAETWFNGRSARENRAEAEAYLTAWMDLTTAQGQGEFDSPDYLGVYVAPLAELYAFADDPAMRQRAGMMLDYVLADYAAERLAGRYVGAHSRLAPASVLEPGRTSAAGLGWLLFGDTPFTPRAEALVLALSGYRPPAILHAIATDRTAPYVHRER